MVTSSTRTTFSRASPIRLYEKPVTGQMPEPVEEGTSVVGTEDVIIESGEDSERSPRQRTLRRPLPNSLYFDIGGMVCDCTDDLE